MKETKESGTPQENLVNYMPGMPALSSEPGPIEQFLQSLLGRRGRLRAVVQNDRSVVTTRSDD